MPNLNIENDMYQKLKMMAQAEGKSIEEETATLLNSVLNNSPKKQEYASADNILETFKSKAAALRKRIGRVNSNSADDIRELRDNR